MVTESTSFLSPRGQSCPILPHCYGPLRAVNGPYVLHKPSLLLTVRMLSTYGAYISLLHEVHNALLFVRSVRSDHIRSVHLIITSEHNVLQFARSVQSVDIRSVHLVITSRHNAIRFVRSVRSARQERRTPTVIFLVP